MLDGILTVLVRSPPRGAALDPGSGDHRREERAPVVSPPVFRRLRRPPHLAEGHDERLGEETTLFEIEEQSRQRGIERGKERAPHIVGMDMRIPTVAVAAIVVDRHKARACLDEPPRHQAGLAKEMTAVAITDRRRLLFQIEGLARP